MNELDLQYSSNDHFNVLERRAPYKSFVFEFGVRAAMNGLKRFEETLLRHLKRHIRPRHQLLFEFGVEVH